MLNTAMRFKFLEKSTILCRLSPSGACIKDNNDGCDDGRDGERDGGASKPKKEKKKKKKQPQQPSWQRFLAQQKQQKKQEQQKQQERQKQQKQQEQQQRPWVCFLVDGDHIHQLKMEIKAQQPERDTTYDCLAPFLQSLNNGDNYSTSSKYLSQPSQRGKTVRQKRVAQSNQKGKPGADGDDSFGQTINIDHHRRAKIFVHPGHRKIWITHFKSGHGDGDQRYEFPQSYTDGLLTAHGLLPL